MKNVEWISIESVIRERQELAVEASQAGVFAYAYGGCESSLIGEAITLSLSSVKEVNAAIFAKLDGQVLTEAEIDKAVRYYYFRYGIYKSFLAKTEGKYRKGAAHG